MKKVYIFAFITSIVLNKVMGFMDKDIIDAYFKEKFLQYGVVFGCLKKSEQVNLLVSLSKRRVMKIVNMNQINGNVSLENTSYLGVVVDVDCVQTKRFLQKSGEKRYFDVRHHWLLLSSRLNITDLFEGTKVYINADINIATPIVENDTSRMSITDFYNPSTERGGHFIYYPLGYYSKEDGYRARIRKSKYWVRRDLSGVTFKTTTVMHEPFEGPLLEYLKNDDKRWINTFNRYQSNLYHICGNLYNYSMDINMQKTWGYITSDGSFDGLSGNLQKKTSDFGIASMFMRVDRMKVLEYGRLTWTLRTAFLFRNPKTQASLEVFLQPLSTETWIFTLLAAGVGMVLLKISLYEERVTLRDKLVDNSWSNVFIDIIGALTQQGFTKTPRFISGRIITIFLFLLFLLIYQFYSASLVSHLLLNVKTTIKNIRDIAMSNLDAGCQDIVYNRDYFAHTTDKDSRRLYFQKIYKKNNKSNFLSIEEGIKLVENGNYAFHVDLQEAYPVINRHFGLKEICELREVPMLQTQILYSCFQKYSPYRDLLESCLQKLAEEGVIDRETKHWEPRKPICIQSGNSRTYNVGLDDLYPAFMALAIGIVLSLIILILEILFHRRATRKRESKPPPVVYPFVK